jgi:hypothetical protein
MISASFFSRAAATLLFSFYIDLNDKQQQDSSFRALLMSDHQS